MPGKQTMPLQRGDFVRVAPFWLKTLEADGAAASFKPFMYGLFTITHVYEDQSGLISPFPSDGQNLAFSFGFEKLAKDEFLTAVHKANAKAKRQLARRR